MHQLEEEFVRKRRDLHLSSNVSLYHQPFFEGKGLRVEFQFETMGEYKAILSALSQLVDKEEFRELIQS
jgi:hypothetical protein